MGVIKNTLQLGLILVPIYCFAAKEPASTHVLMQQWISLEQQKGAMLEAFHQRKEALELQLSLLELEEQSLQQIVNKLDSNTDEVEQERLQLIERQNRLEQDQIALQQWISHSVGELASLTKKVPPPLQSQWQENITYIQQDSHSDSERLERLLSTLSIFNEFNDRIAIHESTINIGDGKHALVKQVYLGASAAWYVSQDNTYFGYGQVTDGAWRWWHGAETAEILGSVLSASAVQEVVTIIENPATAQLSTLPIALDRLGSVHAN